MTYQLLLPDARPREYVPPVPIGQSTRVAIHTRTIPERGDMTAPRHVVSVGRDIFHVHLVLRLQCPTVRNNWASEADATASAWVRKASFLVRTRVLAESALLPRCEPPRYSFGALTATECGRICFTAPLGRPPSLPYRIHLPHRIRKQACERLALQHAGGRGGCRRWNVGVCAAHPAIFTGEAARARNEGGLRRRFDAINKVCESGEVPMGWRPLTRIIRIKRNLSHRICYIGCAARMDAPYIYCNKAFD
ncbi:hypothetical protein F4823DRAFT_42088 [Ustulina deusta]|nr:hypothetical protein F4823DRAFT_42088 [Ustulina deusta]